LTPAYCPSDHSTYALGVERSISSEDYKESENILISFSEGICEKAIKVEVSTWMAVLEATN